LNPNNDIQLLFARLTGNPAIYVFRFGALPEVLKLVGELSDHKITTRPSDNRTLVASCFLPGIRQVGVTKEIMRLTGLSNEATDQGLSRIRRSHLDAQLDASWIPRERWERATHLPLYRIASKGTTPVQPLFASQDGSLEPEVNLSIYRRADQLIQVGDNSDALLFELLEYLTPNLDLSAGGTVFMTDITEIIFCLKRLNHNKDLLAGIQALELYSGSFAAGINLGAKTPLAMYREQLDRLIGDTAIPLITDALPSMEAPLKERAILALTHVGPLLPQPRLQFLLEILFGRFRRRDGLM
jgi:hypothetical protein